MNLKKYLGFLNTVINSSNWRNYNDIDENTF